VDIARLVLKARLFMHISYTMEIQYALHRKE